jgi:hypothetical protein
MQITILDTFNYQINLTWNFAPQKPYACQIEGCCKRYTDPSSLRKHVKNHSLVLNGQGRRKSHKDSSTHKPNKSEPKSKRRHSESAVSTIVEVEKSSSIEPLTPNILPYHDTNIFNFDDDDVFEDPSTTTSMNFNDMTDCLTHLQVSNDTSYYHQQHQEQQTIANNHHYHYANTELQHSTFDGIQSKCYYNSTDQINGNHNNYYFNEVNFDAPTVTVATLQPPPVTATPIPASDSEYVSYDYYVKKLLCDNMDYSHIEQSNQFEIDYLDGVIW